MGMESQSKQCVAVSEDTLRQELARMSTETASRIALLQDSLADHRQEFDGHKTRVLTQQEEHRNNMITNLAEQERKLRSEIQRASSGGFTGDLSLEDADGHTWTFSSLRDYLDALG